MKFHSRKYKIPTLIILGTILLNGCSGNIYEDNSAKQTLTTIPLNIDESSNDSQIILSESVDDTMLGNCELSITIDQYNHTYTIQSESIDKNLYWEGNILSYDYPETASIYKVNPSNDESKILYNPIENCPQVFFQSRTLLTGYKKFNEDTQSYDRLSLSERNSVNYSTIRLSTSEFKQIKTINDAFPDMSFGEYILRSTYPAVSSSLYEIKMVDTQSRKDVIVDTIIDRSFDYYVIRRSIDGIVVGLPGNVDMNYETYNNADDNKIQIFSESQIMFYDGMDIFEVHSNKANEHDVELFLKDQPLLSFEDALDRSSPYIYQLLSDSVRESVDTHIYAAELVYMTVQEYDLGNVIGPHDRHSVSDNFEMYYWPFWIFYVHSNYMTAGGECADRHPILVNAITGEVVLCN